MRINELTLSNYKCFENETFRFNPHFNVIIGKNAAGKTSLLDALAKIAGGYISGISESYHQSLIEYFEVRIITIDDQPKPQFPARIEAVGKQKDFEYQVHFTVNELRPVLDKHFTHEATTFSNVSEVGLIAKKDLDNSRKAGNNVKFPLIAYYGTGRLWKKQQDVADFKQAEGVFSAYKDCLDPKASASYFLSWYKTYEDEVRKFRQPVDELMLKVFNETVSSMVPSWTDMAYSFRDEDLMGIFKDEHGQINKLPFSRLSDGYRNMIGMVADMAYRCIQLNPGLKENVITDTEGIVLIDEIDLHLHPEWQKNIVADLKRVFPKIQFIVTTHSPFIVQSLTKEELIILDKEEGAEKDPYRKSVEEIAKDEMMVPDVERSNRFKEMTERAKEYFTLIKQNDNEDSLRAKIDEAKLRLDKLRVLYSDDPAYVAMLETELEKNELNASGN